MNKVPGKLRQEIVQPEGGPVPQRLLQPLRAKLFPGEVFTFGNAVAEQAEPLACRQREVNIRPAEIRHQSYRRSAAADGSDLSVRADDKGGRVTGLAQFPLAGVKIDDAVNHGEIADYLYLIAAKTAVEDAHHLGGGRHLVVGSKEKALYRPAVQKLAGHRKGHHCRPHAVAGDVHAVKAQMVIQREDVKDIPGNPGRGQKEPVGKVVPVALLVRGQHRLLDTRRHLEILFNLAQGLTKAGVAGGEGRLQGENTRPRMQPRPQFALLDRLAEKVIRASVKPQRQIVWIFTAGKENDIDIVTDLAAADLPAQRQAIHFRHFPVADDQTDRLAFEDLQRGEAVFRLADLIAPLRQHPTQQPTIDQRIFHNQYMLRHSRPLKR